MEIQRFGKFEVLGRLGEGAMGVVYKAQDPILNRQVAIKTISGGLGSDDELRKRFQREARAAASLNHPNIITIHDFGEEQGQIYMALELLEGIDLKQAIGSSALQTIEEKLGVMEQICDGLAFAHSKNIVHRDLKPGNIHIQPNGQVKILDFGLARLGGSDMTRTGIVMGTPNYMSPEQVMGEKVDARSDIFSLGAVFYEILTNHKPFEADSVHAVLYQVVHKDPQPVRSWDASVPMVLVELVEKALAKEAADRFDNAGVLRETLRGIRQAATEGRLEQATLAEMLVLEVVDEADATTITGPGMAGPEDGTLALDDTDRGTRVASPAPWTPPTPPGAARRAAASDRSGVAATVPVAPAPASRTPYYVAALVVAAVLVGAWLALRPAPTPTTAPATAQVMAEILVQTQLDLGRRMYQDKDYQGAIDQADRALRLDPDNAEATKIRTDARETLATLKSDATQARNAFEAGDTDTASEALTRVLALDPNHPVVAELSGRLDQFFRGQATAARQAMAASRGAAESAGATSEEEFKRAVTLARDAASFLASGEFTRATQVFYQARDGFDRARRTAAAAGQGAGDQATPAPVETVPPAPPPTLAPTPLPTPPPTTAPPLTVPPVTAPPPTMPARGFAATRTSIQGAKVEKGGLAGFDTSGVQKPPEFRGMMDFEVSPPEVRAGDEYTIKFYLKNDGKKTVKLKGLAVRTIIEGERSSLPVELQTREVRAGQRGFIGQVSGTWGDSIKAWTLDVTVLSDKGETYRSRLRAE
jgi:serine/threonine-protein kinase